MQFIVIIVVLSVLWLLARQRRQFIEEQALNEEEILKKDTDGYLSRKSSFNKMQKPGELDNSVEAIKYKKVSDNETRN